jgi:repressor LexA
VLSYLKNKGSIKRGINQLKNACSRSRALAEISEKQRKILGFLQKYIAQNGYPPSIRDIQSACNISSTSVVDYNLNALEKEGYIRRTPEISRGIELSVRVTRQGRWATFPVLGYIVAGEPVPVPQADSWHQPPLGSISLPQELVKNKKGVYALKVRGTSMIDALIDDGDTVLVQQTKVARDGDMVVVWLKKEMESTLKKIYFQEQKVRLQPANILMKPIYTSPDNIEIQGKVVAVIRQLGQ